ncbi:D-alanyl-D-alanine carboxypeptidase/D-alanyl-D-alanine endopeptidase [Staphylospora marina]|uniref:D-alanyl-D-alanine carboxypeptidase/D-alanyl-D-alanine endopeptidase n=1 Tax=Staphylospora marina TaxID=2490858 RepID=UPI0013DE37F4|nr:D-alanyl-D-alanine carboxypeptidase/D-alanyl-D-alanine-endopeptidase [Staphylospora marina]
MHPVLERALAREVSDWKRETGERGARVGYSVQDERTGLKVEQHGGEHFPPASNHKLWVTVAALLKWSPDHPFVTRFGLHGDTLWIRGGGDPLFAADGLERVVRWMKRRGHRSVRVWLDDSLFPPERHAPGWTVDDLDAGWAAPVHALNLEYNRVTVSVKKGKDDRPVPVPTGPAAHRLFADFSGLRFSDDPDSRCSILRTGKFRYRISGMIHRDEEEIECAVRPGLSLFRTVFGDLLGKAGVSVSRWISGSIPEEWEKHGADLSVSPLRDVLCIINRESRNLAAEVLLRMIGLDAEGKAERETGIAAAGKILKSAGFEGPAFSADGSGLSVYNLSSPDSLCRLLTGMRHHPSFPVFFSSLPEYGKSGTLKNRPPLPKGWTVRAKTGTLSGVKTLSGYLLRDGKVSHSFSLMICGLLSGFRGEQLQDRFIRVLLRETE